jgi:Flp pilus assembly protein TadG
MGVGRSSITRGAHRSSRPGARGRRGSELVEGMMMMLPFLALVFLIIDTAFGLFVNSTLQYAVQAGANYAALDTANGLMAGIENTVQAQSLNLIPASNVTINFFAPTNMTTPLPTSGGPAPNQAGNVVQLSVSYPFAPLAPLFRSGATITLTATAASVLTAYPPPSL